MIHMVRPSHPGQFVRMEVIEPLGLTVTAAAKALRVTRPALSALLNGRASLSPEMALRIEKAFGPKMDTLLRMQTAYDIAEARRRESKIKVNRYAKRRGDRIGSPAASPLRQSNLNRRGARVRDRRVGH
ncbi:MAG TPA: HigA family addiction module antitoxin [Stellaceae bacterium]|nr:HigA family addiction module antitoxin [Stellaceae bacterium]